MKPHDIAKAWYSVKDEWIVRRNKEHSDDKQWEVVRDWGGKLVSDDTMKVIRRFANIELAKVHASRCENLARAKAVLDLVNKNKSGE